MKLTRSGFTLVEVMVVVVIVAILAAVVTTTTISGLASAKRNACQSNLSQIIAATEMYAGDHDGFWPHPIFPAQIPDSRVGAKRFKAALLQYSKSNPIFFCPADVNAGRDVSDSWQHSKTETSYSESLSMLSRGRLLTQRKENLEVLFNPLKIGNASGCVAIDEITFFEVPGDIRSKRISNHGDHFNVVFLDGHAKAILLATLDSDSSPGMEPCDAPLDPSWRGGS